MKRASFLVAAVLLGACSKAPSKPLTPGEAYFKALNCRSCHMIGGEGAGRGGPDLTMVGFRKDAAWLDKFLQDPQAWKPDTMMPNPRLSNEARGALVEYLSSLKGEAWGEAKPWHAAKDPVEKGRILYAKAGCVSCHGVAGAGGYPNNNVAGGKIPAVNGVFETYTKSELKRRVSRGVAPEKKDPAGAAPMLRMPPWGEVLKDEELDSVVEYLWTLRPGAASGPAW